MIVAICAITGLVLVLAAGIFFYCKYVKGKEPENGKKVLASNVIDHLDAAPPGGPKRNTGLEPMMKMRRAKTQMFRDFVPLSKLREIDIEKGPL